jgi:cobalt/nickel transport system ATP-binding protein
MRGLTRPPGAGAAEHTAPVAALEFRDVSVRYAPDGEPALEGCSLRVGSGERVALLGENGSGKTTILLAAAGLLPHQGEIRVGGLALSSRTATRIRTRLGLLFATPEDQILLPHVLDDVAFGLRAGTPDRGDAEAAARSALERLGAAHLAERSPYELSHGQRLRVALAGAMVSRPPLLLLDEPTGGLDRGGRKLLVESLRAETGAMLVATHDLRFAATLCDRYLLVEGGRVVREGKDAAELDDG